MAQMPNRTAFRNISLDLVDFTKTARNYKMAAKEPKYTKGQADGPTLV